jgi:hypothetical protein
MLQIRRPIFFSAGTSRSLLRKSLPQIDLSAFALTIPAYQSLYILAGMAGSDLPAPGGTQGDIYAF